MMDIGHAILTLVSVISAVMMLVSGVVALCKQYQLLPGYELLRKFRRLPLCAQLLILVFVGRLIVYASVKPNFVATNSPALAIMAPDSATKIDFPEKWRRRGCWDDWAMVAFDDGWLFPYGTGYLSQVVVMSQGSVRSSVKNDSDVASLMAKVSLAPFDSQFSYLHTASNSYRFVWDNGYVDRNTNMPINAVIELFRNGDCRVETNGIARYISRVIPFLHDGIGQDDDWVRANFTNATEILNIGYANWVDDEVGRGLENGVYKLTAEFVEDPIEATVLTVGELSVTITKAGAYVFLLDKGLEYSIRTDPYCESVRYSSCDDLAPLFATYYDTGEAGWSLSGGGMMLVPPALNTPGLCFWMPTLRGSPDVTHIGGYDTITFTACLADYKYANSVAYHWSCDDDNVMIYSPDEQETQISFDVMPGWAEATLSVSATIGTNELVSVLEYTYGYHEMPQIEMSMDVPAAVLLNSNNVDVAKIRPLTLMLISDLPTQGEVILSCESGSDCIRIWDSQARNQEIILPYQCDLSDLDELTLWIEGVRSSVDVNDVWLMAEFCEYGGGGAFSDAALTVVKVGDVVLPGAPEDGLVVLRGTSIALEVQCLPSGSALLLSTLYNVRRLRTDGTYTDWEYAAVNYSGIAATYTPSGGIYQIQALVGIGNSGRDERYYLWGQDENQDIGLKRKGDMDAFGVCDNEWQVLIRNCAKGYLGSTAYLEYSYLPPAYGYSAYPGDTEKYKCNIFVAHRIRQAGFAFPAPHGRIGSYPPTANELADPLAIINNWVPFTANIYPQPGYIAATVGLTCGHCGIVDYDGMGISAGRDNVNRNMDAISEQSLLRIYKSNENE